MKGTFAVLTLLQTRSILTCPHCGAQAEEEMPVNACIVFYTCSHCHQLLRPQGQDCCVFCSYGSVACPPIQQSDESGGCCGG